MFLMFGILIPKLIFQLNTYVTLFKKIYNNQILIAIKLK